MAWFRLERSFRDHRKIKKLARELDCSRVEARGYVVGILCVVCDDSPDGDISEWELEDIADAAGWDADPSIFWAAFISAGWVDLNEEGNPQSIHGFYERAEGYKAAQRTRAARERKQERTRTDTRTKQSRTNSKQSRTRTLPSRDSHVTIPNCHVDRQDKTRPTDKTDPPASDSKTSPVGLVIKHYQTHHPKSRIAPSGDEGKKIHARLKEGFTVEDLCNAIDGCHLSPHHCGKNDTGTKYQSLELIVRNSSKVNQFLAAKEEHGKPQQEPPRGRGWAPFKPESLPELPE